MGRFSNPERAGDGEMRACVSVSTWLDVDLAALILAERWPRVAAAMGSIERQTVNKGRTRVEKMLISGLQAHGVVFYESAAHCGVPPLEWDQRVMSALKVLTRLWPAWRRPQAKRWYPSTTVPTPEMVCANPAYWQGRGRDTASDAVCAHAERLSAACVPCGRGPAGEVGR